METINDPGVAPPSKTNPPGRRPKRRWAAMAAGVIAAVIASIAIPAAAFASISNGPGDTDTFGGHPVFVDGGTAFICIDSNLAWPGGKSWSPTTVTSLAAPSSSAPNPGVAVSGLPLGQMNYILSKHLNPNVDNTTADALYVYTASIVHGESTAAASAHYYPGRADVAALAASYDAEAQAANIGGGSAAVPVKNGSVVLTADPSNNYKGTAVVNTVVPAGATVSLTLSVGTFADGTTTKTVTPGTSYPTVGVPALPQAHSYTISGVATVSGTAVSGTPEEIALSDFTASGQQRVVAGTGVAGASTPWSFQLSGHDPNPRTAVFQPAVDTATSAQYVVKGQPATDQVTAATVATAAGLNNSWFKNAGTYVSVKFDGTAYVSPVKLADGAPIPAGLPVAGTTSLTFGGSATDPTGTTQPATVTPSSGGFLYWVWTYSSSQDSVTPQVVPAGYSWTSQVSQVESTIVMPDLSTRASSNPWGVPIHDTVSVGAPATADMGLSARSQAFIGNGTLDAKTGEIILGDNSKVCTGTPLFTTPAVAITGPGDYTLADYPNTAQVLVKVWQEQYLDSKGNVVYTAPCGEVNEISKTPQLTVTTTVNQQHAAKGDQVSDNSSTIGTVNPGDSISFQLMCPTSGIPSVNDTVLGTTGSVMLTAGVYTAGAPLVVKSPQLTMPVDCAGAYFVETTRSLAGMVLAKDKPGTPSETFNSVVPVVPLSATPVTAG